MLFPFTASQKYVHQAQKMCKKPLISDIAWFLGQLITFVVGELY